MKEYTTEELKTMSIEKAEKYYEELHKENRKTL